MYYTATLGSRECRWDEQDGDRSCRFQLRRTNRDASRAVSTCRGPAGACMSPCGCQDLVLKWAALRVGHGAGASASHNCCAGREGTHEGRYLLEFFLGADVPDGTPHGKGAQRAASDAEQQGRVLGVLRRPAQCFARGASMIGGHLGAIEGGIRQKQPQRWRSKCSTERCRQ